MALAQRDMVTLEGSWDQQFPIPSLDTRPNLHVQPPGSFSRLVGVDGRYATELRRFPGFIADSTIGTSAADYTAAGAHATATFDLGGDLEISYYKYFAIQEDSNQNGILRGVVILGNLTSGSDSGKDAIILHYYRTRTATTHTVIAKVLGDATRNVEFIDVSFDHRHFFVVGQTNTSVGGGSAQQIDLMLKFKSDSTVPPTVANEFWTTSLISPSDPGLEPVASFGISPSDVAGHFLEDGKAYYFAYRIICPEEDMYGPLSPIVKLDIVAGTSGTAFVYVSSHGAPNTIPAVPWASRRYIEFYRTVASDYSGTDKIGHLFLERRAEISTGAVPIVTAAPTRTFEWGIGPYGADRQGLPDGGLVLKTALDPIETNIFPTHPTAKRVQEYDRLLVQASTVNTDDTGVDTEVIRWSTLHRERMNLIPVTQYHKPPDLSDTVLALEKVGPYLAVVYDNYILRMHRSGSRLSLDPLHNRHGVVGRHGAVSIGSNLFLATPVGVLLVDLSNGQMDVLSATQHIFDSPDRWRNTLADVDNLWAAYDSALGALIFYHKDFGEAIVLWMNEGVLTELHAAPFEAIVTGPSLAGGGSKRALWIHEDTRKIYRVDAEREAGTRTMMGGISSRDYNCVVKSATESGGAGTGFDTFVLEKSDQSAPTLLEDGTINGFFAHFGYSMYVAARAGTEYIGTWDGSSIEGVTGEAKRISSLTDGTDTMVLKAGQAFTVNPSGARVAIGGIPFKVTTWPLQAQVDREHASDLFRLKKCVSMGTLARSLSGDTTEGKFHLQMYGEGSDTPLQETEASVTITSGSSFVSLPVNGVVLVPGVECLTADLQFSLLGLCVQGTMEGTRKESH